MKYKVVRKEYDSWGKLVEKVYLKGTYGTYKRAENRIVPSVSDFRDHHDNDERFSYNIVDVSYEDGRVHRFIWDVEEIP